MPGVLEVAREELAASVRIAVPDYIGVRDPAYTSGVGILYNVIRNIRGGGSTAGTNKKAPARNKTTSTPESSAKPGLIERLKNMFSEFI